MEGVALDAGNKRVGEGVLLAAVVLGLDDDDFLAGVAAAGDNGLVMSLLDGGREGLESVCAYHSADLEDCYMSVIASHGVWCGRHTLHLCYAVPVCVSRWS